MTDFLVYDVFTDRPFGGNPLAVIHDATGLPEADLQRIAREFNFSETTFVYPPTDPAHTAKVRIFTPTMEVPFAGHPTIGTAIALNDLGGPTDMVLELGVGPTAAHAKDGHAQFTTKRVLEHFASPDLQIVARCLGIPVSSIVDTTHPPIQASMGLTFVLVEIADVATLTTCTPNLDGFREGAARYPAGTDFATFVYVRNGNQIDARMFAPLDNIPEDPATGSAAAALAALLSQSRGQPVGLTIMQGKDMGRLSYISASAMTTQNGVSAVTIKGQAVRTMTGQLQI